MFHQYVLLCGLMKAFCRLGNGFEGFGYGVWILGVVSTSSINARVDGEGLSCVKVQQFRLGFCSSAKTNALLPVSCEERVGWGFGDVGFRI